MFSLKNTISFDPHSSEKLSEYVTDLKWSKEGYLAASSARGEVLVYNGHANLILSPTDTQGQPIDCLGFSRDGQFLATGGQDGKVRIWQIIPQLSLVHNLELGNYWIEHLAWHPSQNYLAVSLGRYVQVWDGVSGEILFTLAFESSSVLDLAWHPQENQLAVAGNGGIKVWNLENPEDDPLLLETLAAATRITFSPDGEYLAAACLDYTVLVWRWGNQAPWRMTGFGRKVRHLAWSSQKSKYAPILAVSSYRDIFVWKKEATDEEGWISRGLSLHHGIVVDLQFHPHSLLLASVGEEGALLLWNKGQKLAQRLTSVSDGFSCLNWHPSGEKLATGGEDGEVIIWLKSSRGKGFG